MDIRVLHVDDDEDFLDVASSYLEERYEGIDVVGVTSPRRALDFLDDGGFDCVVSDYDMPETDGLELLDGVRDEYPEMPFVLFTSKGSEEVASEAISAGVSDYVRKDSGRDTFDLLVNRIEVSVGQTRAHKEIEEREGRLSNLISNVPGMVYRCTDEPGWPFEFASEGCEELTGFPPGALERDEVNWEEEITHPLDRDRVRKEVNRGIEESEDDHFETEYRIITRGDEVKWVWERGKLVDEEGGTRYLEGVISDVTEITGREDEVQRYETVLDTMADGVYILDREGYFVDVNESLVEMVGYEEDELLGEHVSAILGEDEVDEAEESIRRLIKTDESTASFEVKFVDGEGENILYDVRISPLYEGGSFSSTVGVVRDVTEERKRTEKLKQLHVATRLLVSADTKEEAAKTVTDIADIVLDISTDGLFVRNGDELEPLAFSERAKEVFEEIPSLPVEDSIAGRALRESKTLTVDNVREHRDVYDPDTPVESELFVPIGEDAVFIAGYADEGEFTEDDIEFAEILCSNAHSVFERLEKEEELREREEWFRSLIEYANDIITILEEDATMKYQSPSIERILGYDPEENLGDNAFEWMHPDDRVEMAELFAESVGSDEPIRTGEYRLKHKDGSWRYMESIGIDRREDPAVGGIVINSRDVTERVKREKELERQNERLEKFASIVSHDLRNPLNIAYGSIDIALDSDEPEEHLERARSALERMEEMVDDVLTLAREGGSVEEAEELSLGRVVERAWEDVPTEDATIVVEDDATVEAEERRLTRLLENVFRNSVEHGGDEVTVRAGKIEDSEGFYVEDDGEGIPEDERDEVFEYGYTTESDGTGIGLSVVETISEAHGWSVNLTEPEEGGARFEFEVDSSDTV